MQKDKDINIVPKGGSIISNKRCNMESHEKYEVLFIYLSMITERKISRDETKSQKTLLNYAQNLSRQFAAAQSKRLVYDAILKYSKENAGNHTITKAIYTPLVETMCTLMGTTSNKYITQDLANKKREEIWKYLKSYSVFEVLRSVISCHHLMSVWAIYNKPFNLLYNKQKEQMLFFTLLSPTYSLYANGVIMLASIVSEIFIERNRSSLTLNSRILDALYPAISCASLKICQLNIHFSKEIAGFFIPLALHIIYDYISVRIEQKAINKISNQMQEFFHDATTQHYEKAKSYYFSEKIQRYSNQV